jgi:hypothetical protein
MLKKLHPDYFWTAESGMTGLLIFTLAYLFVVCALGEINVGALVGRLMFSLIIVTGVLATFQQRWLRYLVMVLALVSLGLTWLEILHRVWLLTFLNTVMGMFFLVLLLAILMVQVFQTSAVTPHKIRGAIVVYLLLGGLWSLFYALVALVQPHAFHYPAGFPATDWQSVGEALTYFSFITLTTTGFGDITPAIPLTRTLAMFEALTGQLYLVITLARLVSLAIITGQQHDSPQSMNVRHHECQE